MIKLRKSWCVVMHMLADRGFVIPNDSKFYCEICDMTMNPDEDDCECYNNFISWLGDDEFEARKHMTMIFSKPLSTGSVSIMTVWTFNCGLGDIRKIDEQMTHPPGEDENGVKHAIIIHSNKITSEAAKAAKNLKNLGHTIEPFHEDEVQYVVTRSKLVPKHVICSKAKKEEILKTYNVTKEQMPEIKSTDPIVRYIGATRGQLIKIYRPSESVGHVTIGTQKKDLFDIYYRIVV